MDPIRDRSVDDAAPRPAHHRRRVHLRRDLREALASHRVAAVMAGTVLVVALIATVGVSAGPGSADALTSARGGPSSAITAAAAATASNDRTGHHRHATANLASLAATAGLFSTALGYTGNVDALYALGSKLPKATSAPEAAPPSLANQPPLKPHEVFGFAPYWTLGQSGSFDVQGISTLAYFSIAVNPDGSLNQSGPGWNGYESQALSNLVTRGHQAGDKVVLTVNNFSESQLDQLTHSATAPATLAAALVAAVSAKNLDGVNLDFEGQGSADEAGLVHLVAVVSTALKAANPHYQVTMDTYASSAAGTTGWYDLPALSPYVDAFFIMEYSPNLAGNPSATSPLTSGLFSDLTTIEEYTAMLPPSKVILGLPYFGIDWPTSDGTLTATATGPATDVSLGTIQSSGHPVYWDPVTQSAWTSYQVGSQWHETFFEDPASLYAAAQLAQAHNLAGVGIWALGMDADQSADLAALSGFAPATKTGPAGPAVTSQSPTPGAPAAPAAPNPTPTTVAPVAPTTTTTSPPPTTTTTTTTPPPTTTTTTQVLATGVWNGKAVQLHEITLASAPTVSGPAAGQLTQFAAANPAVTCLMNTGPLYVWAVPGAPGEFLLRATTPGDCTTADFEFTAS